LLGCCQMVAGLFWFVSRVFWVVARVFWLVGDLLLMMSFQPEKIFYLLNMFLAQKSLILNFPYILIDYVI